MLSQNQVKYNDKLSEKQLNDCIETINDNINSDKLYQHYTIISSITSNLENYLMGIYKPTFQKREARNLLLSDDYNENIQEIINDINNAYEETNILRELLTISYNRNNVISRSVIDDLRDLKHNVNQIEDYLDNPTLELVVGLEGFSNSENINEEESDCEIDLARGTMSLAREETINQNNSEAEIIINSESNGFMGNNHEVKINQSAMSVDATSPNETGTETVATKPPSRSRLSRVAAGVGLVALGAATGGAGLAVALAPAAAAIAASGGSGEDKSSKEIDSIKESVPRNNAGPHVQKIGEENNRSDITKIQNSNLDTWFEYELCNISESLKEDPCKGYGFEYSDGTVWARDPSTPDYLLLSFRITLPEAVRINYLDITPFLPSGEVEGAQVKLVELFPESASSGIGQIEATEEDGIILDGSDQSGVFHFNPTTVKEVVIKLMKKDPYTAKIGHKYFIRTTSKEKTKEKRRLIRRSETTTSTTERYRVPGNVDINPGQTTQGGSSGLLSSARESVTVLKDEVESGLEYFYGSRWCIGIKDVGIYSFLYESSSIFVSNEFISPGFVKKIKIEAQEYIPNAFYEDGLNPYENIRYYISIDDGSKWHEISPYNSNREGITEYHINNINIEETSQEHVMNLETENEINRVKVKIELSRPQNIEFSEYYSPIVRGYKLEMYSDMEG